MTRRLRTVLVGVGRMGSTYALDRLTRRHYRHASHAEVLAEHPAFAWEAAVDPDAAALTAAQQQWGFAHAAASLGDLLPHYDPEVLVLATPPSAYRASVAACPGLKAVLCEKPMGNTLADAGDLLGLCRSRGILLQVNFWRRCDPFCCRLAAGELQGLIGSPVVINAFYGNGLRNNGSHVVDFCRMLFGGIAGVQAFGRNPSADPEDPADDHDLACMLHFSNGVMANLQPLNFGDYREVGLDIWGETGRLEILNEGLTNRLSRRSAHRALTRAREMQVDAPEFLPSTVGEALWQVYANLAAALLQGADLMSPGSSALQTAAVIEAIQRSAAAGDGRVERIAHGKPQA